MAPKDVKILQISIDDLNSIDKTQIGVELTADPLLFAKVWGGKDADGVLSRWLSVDNTARVSELMFTDADTDPADQYAPSGSVIRIGTTAGMYDDVYDDDDDIVRGARVRSQKKVTFSQVIGTSACYNPDGDVDNVVAIGHSVMKATEFATNSIAIGTNALKGITSADNVVVIGANARHDGVHAESWGADTRDVLIGSDAGTGVEYIISNTVAIGAGALKGSRAGQLGAVRNKYVLSPNTIWNTIAIGDGAGSNALLTSGGSAIFIGARDTKSAFVVNAGMDNCILIGHGCLGNILGADADAAAEKHLTLCIDEDIAGLVSTKLVIHTDQLGNKLPTMVASLGMAPSGYVEDGEVPRDVVANPLKFFGPMTNMYGSYMAPTSMVILSPGVNGAVVVNSYGVGGRIPEVSEPDLHKYNIYELNSTDLFLHRNVVLFIKPGTLSNNRLSKYKLNIAVGYGIDSNIHILGDTKCNPDQLSFDFCKSSWDTSDKFALGVGDKRSLMCIGDRLTGWDGKARTVNIKTFIASADKTPIISDVDVKALFWVVMSIKQENQMYRWHDWEYKEEWAPIRFTRNKEFVASTHIPKGTPLPTISIVAGPRPGQFVELSPVLYTSVYDTTNAYYNVLNITMSAGGAVYDQINITLAGAGEYRDLIWCIPDDTYTYEGKQP